MTRAATITAALATITGIVAWRLGAVWLTDRIIAAAINHRHPHWED